MIHQITFTYSRSHNIGTITGVAKDQTGALIPNASVTLTNEKTGFAYRTTTSISGTYTVTNLLPGSYTLHVETVRFQPSVTSGINLNANQPADVDARLMMAGAGNSYVEVRGTQPILNTQRAADALRNTINAEFTVPETVTELVTHYRYHELTEDRKLMPPSKQTRTT